MATRRVFERPGLARVAERREGEAKVALITGVTGQDGAYLAALLLKKGYVVHGVKRRASSFNTGRVDHLYRDPHEHATRFFLHHGDLTDATNLIRLVQETRPDEIYNLAAQSHVQVSFETAEYTANADALGTLRLLEAVRILGLGERTRFYQASTSELFGQAPAPQRETTPFYPRSPYAVAKLYAYWITVNYREAYGITPRTASCSTTRARCAARPSSPARSPARSRRSRSACRSGCIWAISTPGATGAMPATTSRACGGSCSRTQPDDYVLATGEAHSVRELVELAFACIEREIVWRGRGLDEVGSMRRHRGELVRVDPRYFRPTEVDLLLGDPEQGARAARLAPSHRASPSWCARWSRPICARSGAKAARAA